MATCHRRCAAVPACTYQMPAACSYAVALAAPCRPEAPGLLCPQSGRAEAHCRPATGYSIQHNTRNASNRQHLFLLDTGCWPVMPSVLIPTQAAEPLGASVQHEHNNTDTT
jgi:hypothetical protein